MFSQNNENLQYESIELYSVTFCKVAILFFASDGGASQCILRYQYLIPIESMGSGLCCILGNVYTYIVTTVNFMRYPETHVFVDNAFLWER